MHTFHAMAFALEPPIAPMLARATPEIPAGEKLVYEPKWDGFRALVFRDGKQLHVQSRSGQPLERYFPEILEPLRKAIPDHSVVDGELVVAGSDALDFDALLLRIHPAASRVAKLSQELPASFVAFDLLALRGADLRKRPFAERRAKLARALKSGGRVLLTPQTDDRDVASGWFARFEGAGLDGVIARDSTLPYLAGERAMWKVKHHRTADCVIGGYRIAAKGGGIASLLLGLYDDDGVLQYVGHTSGFSAAERRALLTKLERLHGESFGAGRTPGAPSRWAHARDQAWVSVKPKLVCEVSYDQLQSGRFRHAAGFVRFRPDRTAASCTFAQLEPPRPFRLAEVEALGA